MGGQISFGDNGLVVLYSQAPEKNPYKIPITTTLATLPSAIMERISAAHMNAEMARMFVTPSLLATRPGARRPKKLQAFTITNCYDWIRRC